MNPNGRRIPDVLLYRHLASALEGEALERVEKLLAESEVDRARLEELRAEASAFLEEHPPDPLVAHIERTVEERKRRRWWWRGALAVPALAGLAALLVVSVRPEERPAPEDDWMRKGGAAVVLEVHRHQAGAGGALVLTGDVLAPGDVLRFDVRSAHPGFLAVVGRDASGTVRVYHPQKSQTSAPISQGLTPLPPFSLGEAPGDEEVYALFSPESFELAPVVRALEESRAVAEGLPSGVKVTRRLLRKSPQP
jgi:hypothetical protein